MEAKGGDKQISNLSAWQYESPLGYVVEDVRPLGGVEKFRTAAYSNVSASAHSCDRMSSCLPCFVDLHLSDSDIVLVNSILLEPFDSNGFGENCCAAISNLSVGGNSNSASLSLAVREEAILIYPNDYFGVNNLGAADRGRLGWSA